MKKTIICLAVAMGLGMSACVDDDADIAIANISGVSISASDITLQQGTSVDLTAELVGTQNGYTTSTGVTWRTSDPTVATVIDGRITAKGAGTATITVISLDGGHEAKCVVTVEAEQVIDPTTVTRYLGGDISNLPLYEAAGVTYRDIDGKKIDVLPFFKENGMNTMRVRIFVNPEKTDDPQVVQDVAYVTSLAKTIKKNGFKWMLDFHYSDTWADPSYQTMPAAWAGLSADELKTKVYDYTNETLRALVAAGVAPDFIQVGNETTYGMLWSVGRVAYTSAANWDVYAGLAQSGCKACRDICPDARIILHVECTANAGKCTTFLKYMKQYGVDYDIFGLSYYPFWHNNLTALGSTLTSIENATDKDIMIVEYAYNYQWYPSDAKYTEAQLGKDSDGELKYPATAEGQRRMTEDLIVLLNKHPRVTGLFWWFPEENESTYTQILSGWLNRGLFDDQTGYALPAAYELKKFVGE